MSFSLFAEKSIANQSLTQDECMAVLHCPDEQILDLLAAAYQVRLHYRGKRVHLHTLINAKSGLCPEDCHYCSQSKISTADIERYPMVSMKKLIDGARQAKEQRTLRYRMVIRPTGTSERKIS